MSPPLRKARLLASLSLSLLVGCLALSDKPDYWPCDSLDDCEGNERCVPAGPDQGSVCFDPRRSCETNLDCLYNHVCDPQAHRCRGRCSPEGYCFAGEVCSQDVCFEQCSQDGCP